MTIAPRNLTTGSGGINDIPQNRASSPTSYQSMIDEQSELTNESAKVLVKNIKSIEESAALLLNLIATKESIEKPLINFNDAIDFLNSLSNKTYDLQTKVRKNELSHMQVQQQEINKTKLQNLRKNLEKTEEAQRKEKDQKISRDVGFGFSTLAFILGTLLTIGAILTGGAALPLAMGVLGGILGGISFACDVGNRVFDSQNAMEEDPFGNLRKKEASIGRLFRLMAEDQLKNQKSFDPKKLSEEQKLDLNKSFGEIEKGVNVAFTVLSIATAIVGAGAMIAPLIKEAMKQFISKVAGEFLREFLKISTKEVTKAAEEATKAVTKSQMAMLKTAAEASESASTLVYSSTDIATASIGIQLADTKYEIKEADNQLKLVRAVNDYVEMHRNMVMDAIKDLSEKFEDLAEHFGNLSREIYQYERNAINRL